MLYLRATEQETPFAVRVCSHKSCKKGIAQMCLLNALKKSCLHRISESFGCQIQRLAAAGYPEHLTVAVAEVLLRKTKKARQRDQTDKNEERDQRKVAVIPYLHSTSHRLKKIGENAGVRVVMSAPQKLTNLCNLTSPVKWEKKK